MLTDPPPTTPTSPTTETAQAIQVGTLAVAVSGHPELDHHSDEILPLASVGKLLLLAEVAHSLTTTETLDQALDPDTPVELHADDYCAGSGLLAQLTPRTWSVADLARLTAAVSDNTATNALIRLLGLDRVNARAAQLGLKQTRLLDRIREPRLAQHPHTFAIGTARELLALAERIAGDEPWARTLLGWMATCTDRTMVPALIPHDPEDHTVQPVGRDRLWVANKTGTDIGTRCDVGVVRGARQISYAVLTSCPPGHEFAMVQAMRSVGAHIAALAA